ncbi:hypothetical protein [Luteimonas suaedae]|uniref:hypothetical protein n=1 Tax=Luteimonas suaedae TaxID=2605430 RepID=UPI0016598B90|nr:hypothetical protein [Luteimonas suaedae]
MVNKIPAVLLDKNHLCYEVSRLFGEALLPDNSDRLWAPEGSDELAVCEEALCALVVLADPLQLLLGETLFRRSVKSTMCLSWSIAVEASIKLSMIGSATDKISVSDFPDRSM